MGRSSSVDNAPQLFPGSLALPRYDPQRSASGPTSSSCHPKAFRPQTKDKVVVQICLQSESGMHQDRVFNVCMLRNTKCIKKKKKKSLKEGNSWATFKETTMTGSTSGAAEPAPQCWELHILHRPLMRPEKVVIKLNA